MDQVDILIVTALQLEFEAALEAISTTDPKGSGVLYWDEIDSVNGAPYLSGKYQLPFNNGEITVALARPTRMGSSTTAMLASALVERLKPRCLAMCGVCAGNPADVTLGDVIIAEMTYAYDEGKRTAEEFQGDHRQTSISNAWLRAAQEFSPANLQSFGEASADEAERWLLECLHNRINPVAHVARTRYFPHGTWKSRVKDLEGRDLIRRSGKRLVLTEKGKDFVESGIAYDIDPPERLPFAVKVGPIASGNVVVKDGVTWKQLSALGVRTVVGLEMEAAAVGSVAFRMEVPEWLVVKGVMDYADPKKDDRYKAFAARASAEVMMSFLAARFGKKAEKDSPNLTAPGRPIVATRPRYPSDISFDRIADALALHAPLFRGTFDRARAAGIRAYATAAEAKEIASRIKELLGPALPEGRESLLKKESTILNLEIELAKSANIGSAIAKLWNSGDEYLGQSQAALEHGLGVYKIYAVSKEVSPDSITTYAGEFEHGKFGSYGVYTFSHRAELAVEWADGHPIFGFEEYFGSGTIAKSANCDFYFGSYTTVSESSHHKRWLPHGSGVGVRFHRGEIECGEYYEGVLQYPAMEAPIRFSL